MTSRERVERLVIETLAQSELELTDRVKELEELLREAELGKLVARRLLSEALGALHTANRQREALTARVRQLLDDGRALRARLRAAQAGRAA